MTNSQKNSDHQYRVFINAVKRQKDVSIVFDDTTFTVNIFDDYEVTGSFSYNETKIYIRFMGKSFRVFDVFAASEFIADLKNHLACIDSLISHIEG